MSIRNGICIAVCVLCCGAISVGGWPDQVRRPAGDTTDPQNESEYHLRHENVGKRSTESEQQQHKDIEYRLTKLEVQVEDKARALKDLEYKTIDLQSGLNDIKDQMNHKNTSMSAINDRLNLPEDKKILKELQQNISMLSETTHLGLGILELLRRDVSVISKDTSSILKHSGYQSRQGDPEEKETNFQTSTQGTKIRQGQDGTNETDSDNSEQLKSIKQQVSLLLDYAYLTLNTLQDIRKDVAIIRNDMSFLLKRQGQGIDVQTVQNNSLPNIPAGLFEVPSSTRSGIPKNCKEFLDQGMMTTGIYQIRPSDASSFPVVCDMVTEGGGWTYILNRYDGSQDFYREYVDYKNGFGNLAGEFWLGLDHIHELTRHEINELYVELVDANGQKVYAHYDSFGIGSELEGYMLKILGGYSGTAGDSLTYHAGNRFSTKDLDQDGWIQGNCAIEHSGAWWYKSCDKTNLNGRYMMGEIPDTDIYNGIYWDTFGGPQHGLAQVRMMIRPRLMNNHVPLMEPSGN